MASHIRFLQADKFLWKTNSGKAEQPLAYIYQCPSRMEIEQLQYNILILITIMNYRIGLIKTMGNSGLITA